MGACETKDNLDERLKIESIDSRFNKKQNTVRRWMMNYIIKNGESFNLKDTSMIGNDIKDMSREEIEDAIKVLKEKNGIVVDEDKNVNYIYPVSAQSTNHRIRLADGSEFTAMCAIDSIGSAFTFKQDVDIHSQCSHCGTEVDISIRDGKVVKHEPDDMRILHVDLNQNANWSGSC